MSEAYRRAGVDIAAGSAAVRRIKGHAERTYRPEVLSGLGAFGACFALDLAGYEEPVLVSGADGVGTKLKIAFAMDVHDSVGIDLVAMCVNDILAHGAEPLFFLDYLACSKVEPDNVEAIVKGIAAGCELAGCSLIGGETAEMPDMYREGEYDLAGFAVGIVDRDKLIDGSAITAGDVLIGLASSGLHSNGYTLVRKLLLEDRGMALSERPPGLSATLGEELLSPTRIYARTIGPLLERHTVKGIAHITGGGLNDNLPRILPPGTAAQLVRGSWPVPPIFELVIEAGGLTEADALTTFNMGIGMVLVTTGEEAPAVLEEAVGLGEKAHRIGTVVPGEGDVKLVDG